MRRMLTPETKIKSKVEDDVNTITIEELLTYAHVIDPVDPNTKGLIIQTVSQIAGNKDEGDGGIYIVDPLSLKIEITNATLTITSYMDNQEIWINGLGINNVIDLSSTLLEDLSINSSQLFDVYIIKP